MYLSPLPLSPTHPHVHRFPANGNSSVLCSPLCCARCLSLNPPCFSCVGKSLLILANTHKEKHPHLCQCWLCVWQLLGGEEQHQPAQCCVCGCGHGVTVHQVGPQQGPDLSSSTRGEPAAAPGHQREQRALLNMVQEVACEGGRQVGAVNGL